MYIKLGDIETSLTTNKNYSDFMIVAGVVPGCQMSYERPVLVRNKEELLLWFGENNTRRDFYEELLNRGVSLYLTKPQSQELDYTTEGYIDLSDYQTFEEELPFVLLPKLGTINTFYNTVDKGQFIWLWEDEEKGLGDYVKVSDLPQFSSPKSSSSYNRDTLTLCSSTLQFYHPRYSGNKFEPNTYNQTLSLTESDMRKIDNGEKSIVFNLTIDESKCEDGDFILFPNKHLVIWGNNPDPKLQGYYTSFETYSDQSLSENSVGGKKVGDYIIYHDCPNVTYFYKGRGITFVPDFKKSQDIIENHTINRGDIIKFWSKTLGGGNERHIKVTSSIFEKENKIYQLEIERFGYNEIFEGTLQELESAINANSLLVGCEVMNRQGELPEGSWELLGSEEETYNSSSYKFSVESLKEEDIFPDFYLIPNPEDYVDGTDDYEQLYLFLLGLTTSQYLIQNNESNYKFNYTKDVDNRLIWFYKNLVYQDNVRDGYYVFLMGLLDNIYSVESTDVIYNLGEEENLEQSLQNYKSNYLTDNEHKCFYKNYQNGKKFNTTALMRFCIEKIRRELEKNKWNFLGKKLILSTVSNEITLILNTVKNSFPGIIRSINLDSYSSNENYLDATISTRISDLPKNDLTLDIKINYIK